MIGSLRCALRRAVCALGASACFCAIFVGGAAQAADVFWEGDDAGDPTNWAVTGNWTGGIVPGVGDNAQIVNGKSATVKSDVGFLNEIHVGGGSRLNVVAGGVVSPDGNTFYGDGAGSTGELVMTGGVVDGFSGVKIGVAGGVGHAQLSGGELKYNSSEGFSNNASFELGSGGTGTLDLNGGKLTQVTSADVNNGDSWNYIGRGGGEGTFNLSSGTASLNSRTHIGIDAGSEGAVNQSGGLFEVRDQELVIADAFATGIYNMTGGELKVLGKDGGGTLIRDIQVGHWENSVGRLNVSGGRVETRDINLANYRGAQGFMEVSGSAQVVVNGWMRVGNGEGDSSQPGATGTLHQTGGDINIVGRLMIGQNKTATGVYNMEGGTLRAGDWSTVGGPDGGHGTFNLSGGTATIANRFHIGGENASTGEMNQTGGTLHVEQVLDGGGAVINAPDMLVGDGRGSKGTFNLSGGDAIVDREMIVGHWSDTDGTVNVSGDGNLEVGGPLRVGGFTNNDAGPDGLPNTADDAVGFLHPNHGKFNQSGGTVLVKGDFSVATGFNSTGEHTMSDGSLVVNGWTRIGDQEATVDGVHYNSAGTFNMTGGHATFNTRVIVGSGGDGTLNQTGGRIDFADIGTGGSGAAFTIGDGDLSKGVYNLSGGEAVVGTGVVRIGQWHSTNATMNVSNTGLLRTAGDVHVGSESDGPANHGTLNQSGGTIDVGGNLILAFHTAGTGDVNLTDGEMHNRNNVLVGDAGIGTFTQTGGTHIIEGDLTMGVQATADGLYTLDGNGVLDMTGGAMNYGAGIGQFAFEGGTLKDAGTINFNLVNNGGTLAPGASPGVTTINGNYNVTSASATYQVEITGLTQGLEYDFLNVAGSTVLGGRLQVLTSTDGPVVGDTNGDNKVDLDDLNNVRNNFGTNNSAGDTDGNGVVDLDDLNNVRNNFGATGGATFVPDIGDSFTILSSAAGVTGTFATTAFPPLPADRHWSVSYLANDVRLSVLAGPSAVPEPATFGLSAVLVMGAGWLIRRQGRK